MSKRKNGAAKELRKEEGRERGREKERERGRDGGRERKYGSSTHPTTNLQMILQHWASKIVQEHFMNIKAILAQPSLTTLQ